MKTIISTAKRIGRVVVLTGSVVVLCVALGAINLAFAAPAPPSSPFLLNTDNKVTKLSSMIGSLSTALLKLDNHNGTGPGLDIQTASGQAPMTVNSDAGTATNLSADKVDGKSSEEFFSKTYRVFSFVQNTVNATGSPPQGHSFFSVSCDAGDVLIEGGYSGFYSATSYVSGTGPLFEDRIFTVEVANTAPIGSGSEVLTIPLRATCADLGEPHQEPTS